MIYSLKRKLIVLVVGVVIFLYYLTSSTSKDSITEGSQELKDLIECNNKRFEFEVYQRGSFWILKNFVKAEHGNLECYESVTYTTTTDIRCIENVVQIAERWAAPVSLALYTPNHLFNASLNSIFYLRNCLPQSPTIRKYVTFHLFFNLTERPDAIWYSQKFNCQDEPPYANFNRYIKTNDTFPINVGRNIASTAALTHFLLKSDSELFPSENFVNKFLEYVVTNKDVLASRIVFIVPTFEIPSEVTVIPFTLMELHDLLKAGKAIFFFHIAKFCSWCFQVPNKDSWVAEMTNSNSLRTHFKAKRVREFKSIEHFYVGTERDPLYPEELTWNMQNDKMAHEYVMCLLDYEYYYLSGAFLVHTPGYHSREHKKLLNFNNRSWKVFKDQLQPMYDSIYGKRQGCVLR